MTELDGHKARVAVPARLSAGTADARIDAANRIFHDIVRLVREHGFEPVVVTEVPDLSGFAGAVLPGGGDLAPVLYGGDPSPAVYDVNPAQDALDLGIARDALERDLPVLGICRGAQVLNIVTGGTLHVDLPASSVTHHKPIEPGREPEFVWHPVRLREGSRLRAQLGTDVVTVASGHHQGLDRLGAVLRPTALADDGLVEAFEDERGRLIGVQWHPEAAGTPAREQGAPFRVFAAAVEAQEALHA
ncbi:gamma-glutamyl-gamma-aminobutyrate hydrolase family protein [Nonomuraea sp. NBC_01738]|uniref:gamma-glutamyl-gamma-aminobutyrate hydrolase family protein n=1 Tax=Nonomuraea sp. NBC_01738 TaxID=2976003 RepID=UPI002E0DFEE7|nr:gamma-glutamyl-gamma-aminobutyrate hydrolase family protein [Nonomuraea sp. NBC_01738]WSG17843.1 gamma-glutamyl-gamma-aminobutyrate hydrolase family protein [Nonomuraea sp. NBC_01738]